MTTDTPLSEPASKPVPSKGLFAAVGDGGGDLFEDQLITPSAVTLGLKSFRLVKQEDDPLLEPVPEFYSLFDADPGDPRVIEFQTGVTEEIAETSSEPREGTYNRIEYEITYLEMIIPLCDANHNCENRRLRFYLDAIFDPEFNLQTEPLELLLSENENGFLFNWISAALGLPESLGRFPVSGNRPTDPYLAQIPGTQLNPSNPSLFSLPLNPPLEVPRNPDGEYIFTLHFDLSNLFFFDNTDEATIDPNAPFHFNALVPNVSVATSRDGKIRFSCALSCVTAADFSPGLPVVTVTVRQETEE